MASTILQQSPKDTPLGVRSLSSAPAFLSLLQVFLQPWGTAARQASLQPGQPAVETVLETWVFHYQPTIMPQGPTLSRSQLSRLNPTSIYKRLVIMLRSLFCYVRVLPAYRMYRVCKVMHRAVAAPG